MDPELAASLATGAVVGGKYEVLRIVGEGGMGAVVAARHAELGHLVALKFVRPEALKLAGVRERFEREARAAARLKSAHVAHVLDVGIGSGGVPYMVMEYLDGEDASQCVARGPLDVEVAARIVVEACDALREAHALGIVHRDLKPSNLFLARGANDAVVTKVLDFGISKAFGESHALTHTAQILGSPLYMSPEQIADARSADARSDVWALGATLYELVVGRAPFGGNALPELFRNIERAELPSAHAARAAIPEALDAVLARALAKAPADRFPDVGAFARALVPFLRTPPPFAWLDESPLASTATPSRVPDTTATPSTSSRSRWPVGVGAALAVALLGLAWGRRSAPDPSAPVAPPASATTTAVASIASTTDGSIIGEPAPVVPTPSAPSTEGTKTTPRVTPPIAPPASVPRPRPLASAAPVASVEAGTFLQKPFD